MLIDFQDAVTASNLDPTQTHAVFYADGKFANRAAVAARCPHARLYGITVLGRTGPGIFAADSETGDMTVESTLVWVATQIRLGVKLICVYANEDRWLNEGLLNGVKELEKSHGVKVRKWLAHYTGKRALEFSWVDAEQYADPGPIDKNVALANFFGDEPPANTTGLLRFAGAFDADTGHWVIHGTPGDKVHFTGANWQASAEIQVKMGTGGGVWRVRGMKRNSGPLGRLLRRLGA